MKEVLDNCRSLKQLMETNLMMSVTVRHSTLKLRMHKLLNLKSTKLRSQLLISFTIRCPLIFFLKHQLHRHKTNNNRIMLHQQMLAVAVELEIYSKPLLEQPATKQIVKIKTRLLLKTKTRASLSPLKQENKLLTA